MTGRTILVTGAAGLVGQRLVRSLAAGGAAVVGTDRQAPSEDLGVRFVAVDLLDAVALQKLVGSERVGRIVHCGAISGQMVAPGDPWLVMAVNVAGTLNLAEAARRAGVARFVAMSSVAVYGDQPTLAPVTESTPLRAVDVYGASKVAAEAVLRGYRQEHGLPVVALRASSIYGPGRRTACFIRELLESAKAGRPVSVSDDPVCRRQFVHVDDVVAALALALRAEPLPDFAYNISGGVWLTELAVAAAVPGLRIVDRRAPPRCIDGRIGPLDLEQARRDLGYAPAVALGPGIADYARHLGVPT
jgi:UDP-glucose 4-epimerase/UDP-glucuronate 4-epimerase